MRSLEMRTSAVPARPPGVGDNRCAARCLSYSRHSRSGPNTHSIGRLLTKQVLSRAPFPRADAR
jgi:hypothetical protein